jgi:hypothetical protein
LENWSTVLWLSRSTQFLSTTPASFFCTKMFLHRRYHLCPRLLLPRWLNAFGLVSLRLKDTPVQCAPSLRICSRSALTSMSCLLHCQSGQTLLLLRLQPLLPVDACSIQ